MKKYLRLFLINLAAIWLASWLLDGVRYEGGLKTLTSAALVLTIINFLIKPLIKILLLPINLITLGMFRWLVNVLSLYLVTAIVPQLQIASFKLPGFTYHGFAFPSLNLTFFWALVITSFLISFTTSLLIWLVKN